jgi:ribonuclease HI
MQYNPYAFNIYIDGSAFKYPGGPGGIAGIVEFPDRMAQEPQVIFQQGYLATINNRMELRACIEALHWSYINYDSLRPNRVAILTDSVYVHNHQTQALEWKRAGWSNRHGRLIENPDLWKMLLSLKAKVRVRTDIEWRRGKSDQISTLVHRLAKEVARGAAKIEDLGYRRGDVARTKVHGSATMFPASGQVEKIRVYRKDMVGRGTKIEYKVRFDRWSEDGCSFESKHFAYTSPENENKLHRSYLYRVQFKDNPKYPIIETVIEEIQP